MFDTSFVKTVDNLLRLLGRRDTSSDTHSFDSSTFLLHLLPERELESELTLIDVESVESNSDTRFSNELLNLRDLGTDSLLVVVPSSGEFDVVSGLETGRNETSFDGSGSPEVN